MTEPLYDVVAIGNAIVDVVSRCDDAFLAAHGAPKGHMRLVDETTAAALYADMGPGIEMSGGSAANTVVGVSSFGGKCAFIGKVADDDLGRIFGHDIRSAGVIFRTAPSTGGGSTARSMILVTPDGQRTMNTFLGVSPELGSGEVDPGIVANARVVYLEGYLFDRSEAKEAFRQAADIADNAGREVSLSLSDGFCVDRHRGDFLELIRRQVSILFANESEITSLYQTSSFDEAVRRVRSDARLAVLTRSEKGCVVVSGETIISVPAAPVAAVVDTTGAGDLFAAGFLYGYTSGRDVELSARLGALAAAEIISHVGARPQTSLSELARRNGLV